MGGRSIDMKKTVKILSICKY